MENVGALHKALRFCAKNGIGCFRVTSRILPLKTHPELGYDSDLPGEEIIGSFRACGKLARETGTRIVFHPDPFVVLNSPNPEVLRSSIAELEYQAEVAEWIGADVITLHGGGGYGDKAGALRRLVENAKRLSPPVRKRLAFENDDRVFTPGDLLPVCRALELPLVYDVHHHRCNPCGLSEERATERAIATWNREPLFHISSPRDGWGSENHRYHSDFIDLRDFPKFWDTLDITVEVEAKAKELAVLKLAKALHRRAGRAGG